MFKYVAAAAVAVTLFSIGQVLASDAKAQKKEPVRWTIPSGVGTSALSIKTLIDVSAGDGLYFMSATEQRVLKKALFASVTVVHEGERRA